MVNVTASEGNVISKELFGSNFMLGVHLLGLKVLPKWAAHIAWNKVN